MDYNHYIIDSDVAPVIREIFDMAKEGITPTDIAEKLSKRGLKLPSEVIGNTHTRNNEIKRGWNRNTIVNILRNETYLGCVRNGITKKISYKSKKVLTTPKNEWIIKKGMHEAIVDEETFNIVQEQIKSRTGVRKKKYDWLLKGLLECKECGKKLSVIPNRQRNNKTIFYLRCNTYANAPHLKLCTSHSGNLEKITNIIVGIIKGKCKEFLDANKYIGVAITTKNQVLSRKNSLKNAICSLEKKLSEINNKIDKLYDDKCSGILNSDDFTRIYQLNVKTKTEIIEKIEEMKNRKDKDIDEIDICKIVENFVSQKEITREMIVSLVDKIEISNNKEITIHYKFSELNKREQVE